MEFAHFFLWEDNSVHLRGCLFLQRHSVCGVLLLAERSNSVSTIDSSESRRPSDSARVPETLKETDSATYDEQWTLESRAPWEYHQTRQQWHRDRWLFNEHINKQSSDVKFPDADSGTDLNHVSESSVFEESKLSNLHTRNLSIVGTTIQETEAKVQ